MVEPQEFSVTFLDVGQGDSAVICLPHTHTQQRRGILIDCPAGNAPKVLEVLHNHQVTELALVVVTHTDDDHSGGVIDVIKEIAPPAQQSVTIAYIPDSPVGSSGKSSIAYKNFVKRLLELKQQKTIRWWKPCLESKMFDGVTLHFLHPDEDDALASLADQDRNTPSQVILLDFKNIRILFAADMTDTSWQSIVQRQSEINPQCHQDDALRANVMKVPHHGGSWQSTESLTDMLRWVQPEYLVISTGSRNPYGHPTEQFFRALRQAITPRRILCTQATPHLCRTTPGIIHVCAGSIEMRIADGEDEPQISPTLSSHLSRMHGLTPACQDWLPQDIPHKVG